MAESALPPVLLDAGLWVGLTMTLLIFSLLAGDNALARLAQHLLVGASMGYAALMAIQYVISRRLLAPLAQGEWATNAAPLALSLLLLAAGLDRIFRQGVPPAGQRAPRVWLQVVGVFPLALLLGVGIATGVVGIVQGTLFPQMLQVLFGTWQGDETGLSLWLGALTLLLTTATLLHMTLDHRTQILPLARPVRDLLLFWVWLGERALWLAMGIVLARLFASRLTLLVERLDYLAVTLQATGLWQWFASIWQNLIS